MAIEKIIAQNKAHGFAVNELLAEALRMRANRELTQAKE